MLRAFTVKGKLRRCKLTHIPRSINSLISKINQVGSVVVWSKIDTGLDFVNDLRQG